MADPAGPAVAETHISVVFMAGDRAYKLKKPVHLDFLDLRTAEQRAAACRREVDLNRRLAPDVYLGVATLTGEDGEVLDHLVVMRRMPDDRRLATLVEQGADVEGCVHAVARAVAAFHASAEQGPAIDAAATRDAVAGRWEDSFATLDPFAGGLLPADGHDRVRQLVRRYLAGRDALFAERVAAGAVRDGHGDLLADDVFCLDDGPRVLDCLEFDDELRWGDVLADVAFLAMDLERLGRPDLAARFLADYRELCGERFPASLADHYVAYRAHVRCKVNALRHEQGDADAGPRARQLLELTARHLEAARVRCVLVGGLPGTGKTTLAEALGDRCGWVVLRSDEIRKRLAGLPATARAGAPPDEGLYTQEMSDRTYAELLGEAERLLARGESVVLDASWHEARRRDEARRVAAGASAEVVELECRAAREVAAERLRRRGAAGTDASDATPEVADLLAGRAEPWPEATGVDTTRGTEAALEAGLAAAAPERTGRR